MSIVSAWEFLRVADDPLTAGNIILTISHMISFRRTLKTVTHQKAHQLYGTMKTSLLGIPHDTWPVCAAAKSHSINQQMHPLRCWWKLVITLAVIFLLGEANVHRLGDVSCQNPELQ